MWGTLLGCVREGSFLKHDYDIDVGILADDYANKDILIAAMRRRGYELAFERLYKQFVYPASKLWLDVDVLYRWNGRMITSVESDGGEFNRHIFLSIRSINLERSSSWMTCTSSFPSRLKQC